MSLKPQDILIVLKLVVIGEHQWSYSSLAYELVMSPSEVHAGVKRATECHLMDPCGRRPLLRAVEEFLICGVKYVFPPRLGGPTRGIPTAYAAPPLVHKIVQPNEPPPVWAYTDGHVRGFEFEPLYKSAPRAALNDQRLYELLALLDAIRGGRARERGLAEEELRRRLRGK
jgi:hypothetical protein